MKNILFILILLSSFNIYSQEITAYKLFNKDGKEISINEMLKNIANIDVFFFGEYHNDPIGHWIKYELIKKLYELKGKNFIIGSEIFESDNQLIINEYINGVIPFRRFEDEARLWPNYKTDYKKLIDYAATNSIPVFATNVPRRYASIVATGGFEALETLNKEALNYLPNLPISYDEELPGYKAMLQMGAMGGHKPNPNLPKAQALKDATMAHFISKNLCSNCYMFHFNGSYHTDNYEGIIWYLKRIKPNIKIATLSTVNQKDLSELDKENANKADFILVINENMTNTH